MQNKLRRFLLTGAIFSGLLTVAGSVFWFAMSNTSADAMSQGMAFYNKEEYVEAAQWFRKSAEQGLPQAQYHLGRLYDNGEGVTEDNQQAVQWYRQAAEQKHAQAQLHLGGMYQRGAGVIQDKPEALKWFRKAAEQGDVSAQKLLAVMNGRATTRNDTSKTVVGDKQKTAYSNMPKSSCPNNQYALTVNATPPTSRIRVMNIRHKYQPGICLRPKRYDIYVTHRGYHGYRKWIAIEAADVSLDVALTPK